MVLSLSERDLEVPSAHLELRGDGSGPWERVGLGEARLGKKKSCLIKNKGIDDVR